MSGDLAQRLGIRVNPNRVSARGAAGVLPVPGNTTPHGHLHGGASAAFAEHLASLAAQAHAAALGGTAVGIELSISHLASAASGEITGEATALHLGRTLATYAVSLRAATGVPVAQARVTCLVRAATAAGQARR